MSNKNKSAALTRQGVKDLSFIPSKPRGIVLQEPPKEENTCQHRKTRTDEDFQETICLQCNQRWDYLGQEIE